MKPAAGFSLLLVFCALILAYARLFFGFDVTDEAYFSTTASLSSLGGLPFVNDSYFQQTAALVMEPLVYLYRSVFESFGLILFVRHLFFFLGLTCAYGIFRVLRIFLSWDLALVIAILPAIYIPYPGPTLSYNATSSLLFMLGASLTIEGLLRQKFWIVGTGAFVLALGSFAHPLFGLAGVLVYLTLLKIFWQNRRLLFKGASVGLVCYLSFWSITIARVGLDPIINAIQMSQLYGSGKASGFAFKWRYFLSTWADLGPPWWTWIIAGVSLAIILARKWSWTWIVPIVAGVFIFTLPEPLSYQGSPVLYMTPGLMVFLFVFSWLALPWSGFRGETQVNHLCIGMVAVGFLLGIMAFINSATQLMAVPLGLQFGFIFLFARAATIRSRVAILVPLLFFYGAIHYYGYQFSYREGSIGSLNTWMTKGPFAGLRTGAFKAEYFELVEEDLRKASEGASTLLVYDNFPAGYLMAKLRPATHAIFIHPLPYGYLDRQVHTEYYREDRSRWPDVILQMELFPYDENQYSMNRTEWTKPPHDSFFDYLPTSGEYQMVVQREMGAYVFYRIWRRR
ncbi:MAG: hypothetical protein AB7F86_05410 [Bdellovibrionales bacterium]